MERERRGFSESKVIQTCLVTSRLHTAPPPLSWAEREVLRSLLQEAHEPGVTDLLTWCVLPQALRLIVRFRLDGPGGWVAHLTTMGAKMWNLHSQFGRWRKHRGIMEPLWHDRYKSRSCTSRREIAAAAVAVDGMPLAFGLVKRPEDYFSCAANPNGSIIGVQLRVVACIKLIKNNRL